MFCERNSGKWVCILCREDSERTVMLERDSKMSNYCKLWNRENVVHQTSLIKIAKEDIRLHWWKSGCCDKKYWLSVENFCLQMTLHF